MSIFKSAVFVNTGEDGWHASRRRGLAGEAGWLTCKAGSSRPARVL
ncbi:MAG: hypothetical protein HY890_03325 [Deltaproteobacteria bacterium]|nr:hypothetical protein [Deltaproteobacteria bacterium]